jgi:hypothetical protein
MKNFIKDDNGKLYDHYSDEEYHACDNFVGSSTLKKIINGKSTDYLLQETKDKIEFRLGTAFHSLVQDKATGKKEFEKLFQVTDLSTRPTDILDIIKCNNADELITRNKDDSIKKNDRNHWINETKESGYKFLLKKDEIEILHGMLDNFFSLKFKGHEIGECLANSIIEKPYFWEDDIGLKKKCKPDFYFFIEDEIFLFDIKTYGKEIERFGWEFNDSGYWVQASLYREGVKNHNPEQKVSYMNFAVCSKKQPLLSQIYPMSNMEEYILEEIESEYRNICYVYKNWLDSGKQMEKSIKEDGKLYFKIRG